MQIEYIPEETLNAFGSYSWPGNIRELQNVIERAVILSNDGLLTNPRRLRGPTPFPPFLHEPDSATPNVP